MNAPYYMQSNAGTTDSSKSHMRHAVYRPELHVRRSQDDELQSSRKDMFADPDDKVVHPTQSVMPQRPIETATFRSYSSLVSVLLQLIRHCQSVVTGKERDLRERGLALSSQPANQDAASVTLAVPLLKAPLPSKGYQAGTTIQAQVPTPELHEGSDAIAYNTQSPRNSSALLIPMPEPSIYNPVGVATALPPAASAQCFDITLTPIVPEPQVSRYERNVPVKDESLVFNVKKGPLDCSEEPAAVEGWEPLTHPEGALFFCHPYERVFTDANVRDPVTAAKIDKAVEKAHEEARKAGISLDPSMELGLELMEVDGKEMWGYYFADHDRRVIFWFEDHESSLLMNGVRGVEHKSHVRYALETQYWRHIELFPNKRSLPEDVVVKLKEIVIHAHAENITSETCLAPFSSDEVASMLGLMDLLMNSTNKECEHSVWIVARCMRLFCELRQVFCAPGFLIALLGNAKFVNFCGQPGARLNVDQSLYGGSGSDTRWTKILFYVMNAILFGSPDAQNRAVHRIWVDDTMVQPRWENFINRLTNEWNGYTIFSTVMLAVDISFLAVPSVQNQTPAILLAYLSTLSAMGSLVVSLILAGQVNDNRRGSAEDAASFMVKISHSMLGLESLALMLSLPFALLIWGMVFFAAALFTMILRTSGVVTKVITYSVWAPIFFLATWPILAANDIHISHLWYWITNYISRLRSWIIERTVTSYV
ncbi:hypothetical protein DFH29DRAFT_1082912 [Suillus ampliporus]|nr:hypothetical protein DFH29DRAFT_1082912 [Suillus ampliporus]